MTKINNTVKEEINQTIEVTFGNNGDYPYHPIVLEKDIKYAQGFINQQVEKALTQAKQEGLENLTLDESPFEDNVDMSVGDSKAIKYGWTLARKQLEQLKNKS